MRENRHRLVTFTLGQCPDHKGRYIEDVWQLSHFWLEHTHDYIQWLFPLPESSRFNTMAPRLDATVRGCFAKSLPLRQQQQHSLDIMLGFFGLRRVETEIVAQPHLNPREHIWLKRGGHNHLRITRIIRSLSLCHQPDLAHAFQQAVLQLGTTRGAVAESSLVYWRTCLSNLDS